jgi:hypothetical protein
VNVTTTSVAFQPAAFAGGAADTTIAIAGAGVDVAVGLGVDVDVGDGVDVDVGVGVCVAVDVAVDVDVGVGDGVDVDVGVGVCVAVDVAVDVDVGVGDGVDVEVGVGVRVAVDVAVGVGVGVLVAVAVRVAVAVAVARAGGVAPQNSTVRNASPVPASVTLSVFFPASITVLSKPRTCAPKSEGSATVVPLTAIQAERTRSSPSSPPFVTCMTKGAMNPFGTVTVAVKTSFSPCVRSYRSGPQKR